VIYAAVPCAITAAGHCKKRFRVDDRYDMSVKEYEVTELSLEVNELRKSCIIEIREVLGMFADRKALILCVQEKIHKRIRLEANKEVVLQRLPMMQKSRKLTKLYMPIEDLIVREIAEECNIRLDHVMKP
ncbi:hypothetical protein ANN_22594, partial [Periplaneta americana]